MALLRYHDYGKVGSVYIRCGSVSTLPTCLRATRTTSLSDCTWEGLPSQTASNAPSSTALATADHRHVHRPLWVADCWRTSTPHSSPDLLSLSTGRLCCNSDQYCSDPKSLPRSITFPNLHTATRDTAGDRDGNGDSACESYRYTNCHEQDHRSTNGHTSSNQYSRTTSSTNEYEVPHPNQHARGK